MPRGIVYLLTNPAMPGLCKIGLTTRADFKKRVGDLYNTSVPVPFECLYACEVDDCQAVEKALHQAFSTDRINPKREFFQTDPDRVIPLLKLMGKGDLTRTLNSEMESVSTEDDRAAAARLNRRPNLNFEEMGIPKGAILVFENDPTQKVIVNSAKRVLFNGQERSLTSVTKELLKLNYAIQPTRKWLFEGRNLREIYDEAYPLIEE